MSKRNVETVPLVVIDYLVAQIAGRSVVISGGQVQEAAFRDSVRYAPTDQWHHAHLLEQFRIGVSPLEKGEYPWKAAERNVYTVGGTFLEAGMRCLVLSHMGEMVEVPKELLHLCVPMGIDTYRCQNCCFSTEDALELLEPPHDLWTRVAAGEVMPAGECPECQSLVNCTPRQLVELSRSIADEVAEAETELKRLEQ